MQVILLYTVNSHVYHVPILQGRKRVTHPRIIRMGVCRFRSMARRFKLKNSYAELDFALSENKQRSLTKRLNAQTGGQLHAQSVQLPDEYAKHLCTANRLTFSV